MGPKSKKPAKNAFSFFLDEYVEKMKQTGRHISLKIAAEECGIMWQKLSESEKEKYVTRAKTFKLYNKNDKAHKFTSIGLSFADLEQHQMEVKKKLQQSEADIKSSICNLDIKLLKKKLFYIIHCNYYCKTSQGLYVPGEMAIVEFNLADGIKRTFHTLINPGDIPLGYALEAKKTIEEIHGLPYPPYSEGESNYIEICNGMFEFIKPGKESNGSYPFLYCLESNIEATENIIQELMCDKGQNPDDLKVYILHKMFFWLKNKCIEKRVNENIGFPVMSTAENEITKDSFCYVPGISCSFHAMLEDKYHNCSLSIVQRNVYVICDHCCQYIDVPLIPGKHSRPKSDLNRKSVARQVKKAKKQELSLLLSEVDSDAQSSYVGGDSPDWTEDCEGSFLQNEIETKFSNIDISSISSRFGRPASTVGSTVTAADLESRAEEEDSDDEFVPLGRGSKRF